MKRVLGPTAEPCWEYRAGASTVFVIAGSEFEARRKAEALLRDLGVLSGGPPGLHESFERMCEFARGGRR